MDWYTKFPGQPPSTEYSDGIVETLYGPADAIRLPAELGGRIQRVMAAFKGRCFCAGEHTSQVYVLETVCVCECVHTGQFLWAMRPVLPECHD